MASNGKEVFLSGWFTSTGSPVTIPLRFNPDFMEVLNYTQMSTTATPGAIVKAEWQQGMADGTGIAYTKTNASNALNGDDMTSNGFSRQDTSVVTFGASTAFTGITNASPPVVATATTTGVANGDTVRIFTTAAAGAYQLAGMDFTIASISAGVSFTLAYMGAPGDAAPGAGTFRKVNFDPMFYPRRRFITNVTQATQAVVTLSVTHGYVVGEKVTFVLPIAYGMKELNGRTGQIVAINTTTNTITLDIDSSGFTAFAFPRATAVPFTFAQVVPVGEIPSIVTAANNNASKLQMLLGSNVVGANADVLYWRAWKAFENFPGTIPSA